MKSFRGMVPSVWRNYPCIDAKPVALRQEALCARLVRVRGEWKRVLHRLLDDRIGVIDAATRRFEDVSVYAVEEVDRIGAGAALPGRRAEREAQVPWAWRGDPQDASDRARSRDRGAAWDGPARVSPGS